MQVIKKTGFKNLNLISFLLKNKVTLVDTTNGAWPMITAQLFQ